LVVKRKTKPGNAKGERLPPVSIDHDQKKNQSACNEKRHERGGQKDSDCLQWNFQ